MGLSKYNRDRPFLVVKRIMNPAPGSRTQVKDWKNTGNMVVQEHITIVDSVTNKLILNSYVIIDLFKKKLVRNRIDDSTEEEIINHFFNHYKKQISEGVDLWIKKKIRSAPEAAQQLIADLQEELAQLNNNDEQNNSN